MVCFGDIKRNGIGWWVVFVECLFDVGGMVGGEMEWIGVSLVWGFLFCRYWELERGY